MGNILPPAAPSMVEEWEANRRVTVDSFERLCGKGHSARRVAASLGFSAPCIRALQATFQKQQPHVH